MRSLLRPRLLLSSGCRDSAPQYRPEANQAKLRNWIARLSTLSTQPSSKIFLGQLGTLIGYYGKQSSDNTKPIDWNNWNSRIVTRGLVDTVRTNFEAQSKEEYELDKIFSTITSSDSKALEEINNEMAFHTMIWVDNYTDYILQLADMTQVSNMNDYTSLEWMDLHSGGEAIGEELAETHNYIAGSKDDTNLFGYMAQQFSWGKKVVTFFRHPGDDNKAARATKNAMGR